MSRYTTELRHMLENPEWTDERLGLTEYPIFDETYRDTLNKHIKDFFMFWEIGFETPFRFATRLKATLDLIMPYYNQLYLSARASIDPFITMQYKVHGVGSLKELLEIVRDRTRDETGNSKTDGNRDSKTDTVTHDNTHSQDGGSDSVDRTNNNVLDHTGESHGSTNDTSKTVVDEDVKQTNSGNDQSKTTYDTDVYDHGFAVQSDTPEGFMATDNITANTYASNANKERHETEKTGTETTDTTYGHIIATADDSTTTVNADGTSENSNTYKDETNYTGKDVSSYGKSNDSDSWGTIETTTGETTGSVTDNIINEIIKELENHNRNQDTDNWTTYDGFSGTTMSEMLTKWRSTFINIDKMIIEELKPLFISLMN